MAPFTPDLDTPNANFSIRQHHGLEKNSIESGWILDVNSGRGLWKIGSSVWGRFSRVEDVTGRNEHPSDVLWLATRMTCEEGATWLSADLLALFTSPTGGLIDMITSEFEHLACNYESDTCMYASTTRHGMAFPACTTCSFMIHPGSCPTGPARSAVYILHAGCAEHLTSQTVRCLVTAPHCLSSTQSILALNDWG